jgi:RNA polymerase sigma-70 factor (ECF subfamily)
MVEPGEFSEIFRSEWSNVVATLMRDLGDLDLAEDATQEAFVAAAERWRASGWPKNPGGWLVTTARHKAIDRLRRQQAFDRRIPELVQLADQAGAVGGSDSGGAEASTHGLVDERLALILGCCHPALPPEGQVALTLRIVAGLSTAQIARAFLVSEATMTRRITRAKRKIAGANIAFRADRERLVERLVPVCAVIYSIYTEGHASATDASLLRGDLCEESLWLAGLLSELVPDDPEVSGLLALLLLSDARRAARVAPDGSVILLPDQDRAQWDQAKIAKGLGALATAHAAGRRGPYQLQAAVAALHSTAPSFDETDWARIIDLYDVLLADSGDAVIALNRAAAIGHQRGATDGLSAIEALLAEQLERLANYPYLHACRGEFEAKVGRVEDARLSFARAIEFTENSAERAHLQERLNSLPNDD